ncbi:MAG: hypothetical protein ACE14T_11165 [Syntrophales bacterium]
MDREIEILQHSLGLDWERKPYRNYYAAAPGDFPEMDALVEKGLMKRGYAVPGNDLRYYHVTDTGKKLAIDNLPPLPAKKIRRYRRFLDAQDAYPGLTFKEFLTNPLFEDAREDP